ncbi:hypothetical protein CERSUDRAFT_117775 [Gelatoporia subvermispora B]|uniref:Uncharacterized protein n=1 Tax=Ceriporiopsis subvermispora (strain B) TaxID=914234 RepID=M2PD62_CERS8|nr:hypothetical protein CERSUDRAFT_117775 [Gelatoporia subvermispora B]
MQRHVRHGNQLQIETVDLLADITNPNTLSLCKSTRFTCSIPRLGCRPCSWREAGGITGSSAMTT